MKYYKDYQGVGNALDIIYNFAEESIPPDVKEIVGFDAYENGEKFLEFLNKKLGANFLGPDSDDIKKKQKKKSFV